MEGGEEGKNAGGERPVEREEGERGGRDKDGRKER